MGHPPSLIFMETLDFLACVLCDTHTHFGGEGGGLEANLELPNGTRVSILNIDAHSYTCLIL